MGDYKRGVKEKVKIKWVALNKRKLGSFNAISYYITPLLLEQMFKVKMPKIPRKKKQITIVGGL